MQVGSIVVCVDDSFSGDALRQLKQIPTKNKQYMIREVMDRIDGSCGVLLEEIINPPRETIGGFLEPKFKSNRFRELDIPPDLEDEIFDLIYEPVIIER